jgi:hypothetical protein
MMTWETMMTQVKTIKRLNMKPSEVVAKLKESGSFSHAGLTFTSRKENDDSFSISYGYFGNSNDFFLPNTYSDEWNELHLFPSFGLGNAIVVANDVRYIAAVLGVDGVAENDTYKLSVIDDPRDTEIARLQAQLEVYKSLMPTPNKVTYEA